jgi:DNA-directed RNA polymerase subunit RPC12/RpoP
MAELSCSTCGKKSAHDDSVLAKVKMVECPHCGSSIRFSAAPDGSDPLSDTMALEDDDE